MQAPGRRDHYPFQWKGHRLDLLAERAIWDPAQQLLLVADLHLGKAETFQAHGIPLPSDGDAATLNALLALAYRWRPREVVVLGDLIHGRIGLTAELRAKIRALPDLLGCPLTLIGGNHDQGSWFDGLVAQPSGARGPLWLSHGPEPLPAGAPERLQLCGHLHPVAVIGEHSDLLRLPCFSYDPAVARLVLPAFGRLTGGHPCDERTERWLVAEGSIVPWYVPAPPPVTARRHRSPRGGRVA
jgi:DNA ligase-associated metallophosphoesterase